MPQLSPERLEPRNLFASSTLDADGVLRVVGTPGNDTIDISKAGRNVLRVADGVANADFPLRSVRRIVVLAGDGNDTVTTRVHVRSYIDAGAGDDTVATMPRHVHDILIGGDGNDSLSGGDGGDYLDGGAGNDTLDGGTGNDTLIGGTGDDTLLALSDASGDDSISGGDGTDTLSLEQYRTKPIIVIGGIDLPATSISDLVYGDVERIVGSPAKDDVTNASGHAIEWVGFDSQDKIVG